MRRHSLQRMQWIGMTKFASRRNRIYKLNVFPLKFPGKYGEKTENEIEQDVSSFNWKGRWNSRLKTTNWINRHCRGKFELCGFFIFKSNLKRFLNFMCSFLFQFNLYIHRHPARWAWMRTTSQSCVIFRWRKKMIQNLYERQWKICIKMILRSWRIVQFVDQKKNITKLPLTPKKVTTIENLFRGRLSRVISMQDMETRCSQSYLNRLISDAIGNISKKLIVHNDDDNNMMAEDFTVKNEMI